MEKNTTALNDQNCVDEVPEVKIINNSAQEMLDVTENESVIESSDVHNEQFPDYSIKNLKEIIQIFTDMLNRGEQQELYKHAEFIKAAFYKVLKKEKIAAGVYVQDTDTFFVDAEGGAENRVESGSEISKESSTDSGVDSTMDNAADSGANNGEEKHAVEPEQHERISNNPFAELERGFKELYSQYKVGRQNYIHNIDKIKEENLAKKTEIIEELKVLLDKAEDINHTFPAFRELQNKWKSINNMVPQAKAKDLWDSYQHCVEKFYDYIKINNEFRDLDFRKNLEAKVAICERAEALDNDHNVVNAFKELQKLHEDWKELGPVAKEEREAVWERFKAITSIINKKHQHFFEKLKENQKANLDAKTLLCEEAEEISSKEVGNSNEWNALSKQMEALQAKWKGIGFAAKKDNQKIYDRFRVACDKFYNAKRDYYSDFKNVMQVNLKKKEELCEQAEALMDSDDWKKATDQLINLQKVWKEIGPVARKQSDIVWKRFRVACDHFFEKKASHFGQVDEKFDENLAAKCDLIEQIKNYKLSESKDENIKAMKEFLSRWTEIGFVPFKEKEKTQTAFNSAMDIHFSDIRSIDTEKKLNKFKRMISDTKNSGRGDRGLRFEREKLTQKFRKMELDISTLENNMGFFAKSKNADVLIADIQKKIAIAREELAQIEEKIKLIDKQFE
ncbi:MAG: DUF349 domain-containing protein [Bacteroidales bacterium]